MIDAVNRYDAIWGAICELNKGEQHPKIRPKQDIPIQTVQDILQVDPFYSLQMGHFVRGEVAAENPFCVKLDTGEDFDYYLRIWHKYRCVKLKVPLFINRRGMHSKGPKSAPGSAWRRSVKEVKHQFAKENHIDFSQ